MCRNTEDEPAFVLLFFNAGKFTNIDIQWFVGALAGMLGPRKSAVQSCCGMLSAATRRRMFPCICLTGCQGHTCMCMTVWTVYSHRTPTDHAFFKCHS